MIYISALIAGFLFRILWDKKIRKIVFPIYQRYKNKIICIVLTESKYNPFYIKYVKKEMEGRKRSTEAFFEFQKKEYLKQIKQ